MGPDRSALGAHGASTIKHDYFHQSVPQAWLTRTVPAMAVVVGLILLAGWLLRRLIRRLARHHRVTAN
jgi:flagellar biogenesis protein FliO